MWNDLTLPDKARMIRLAVSSGITDLRTIHDVYNKYGDGGPTKGQKLIDRINRASQADFVKRLQDENRKYIDYGDSIATHRMAYATDDDGRAIVYPEVQSVGDTLEWFKGKDAIDRAIENRDTLMMSIPEAEWFTTHYKDYYPKGNTFGDGGPKGDKNTLNSPRYNAKQEEAMYNYMRDRGLNEIQASAILGNLAVESYLNADLHQIGGGPAYGLMQAEGQRQRDMRTYDDVPYQFGAKLSPEEQQQLDYIIDKGVQSYKSGEWGNKGFRGARQARQAFLDVDNLKDATNIITYNFLRPGKPHTARRQAMAEYYYDKYKTPYFIPLDAFSQ